MMKVKLVLATIVVLLANSDNDVSGQIMNELFKITPSDGTAGDRFGASVAISGSLAIVGSRYNNGSGAAYIFDLTTGDEIRKLVPSDSEDGDEFGRSVGISGTVAIVGSPSDDDAGPLSGSAYLFDIPSGIQLAKLTASDAAADDRFGFAVAVHGLNAIVGAYDKEFNGLGDVGAAYIYDFSNINHIFDPRNILPSDDHNQILEKKITASDWALADSFGYSVAISNQLALVGAPATNNGANNTGSAYLFDVVSGDELSELIASDAEANDDSARSIAIDGSRAIVSGYHNDDAGNDSGSAYLYQHIGSKRIDEIKVVASDAAMSDEFGRPVDISGRAAIVVALNSNDRKGAGYLLNSQSGRELVKLIGSDARDEDDFGAAVAISGKYVLIGAPRHDDIGEDAGTAYVFRGMPEPLGDMDFDDDIDADDIDTLYANFFKDPPAYWSDLDGDGDADEDDLDIMLHDILSTDFGDADLNGVIDVIDFGLMAGGFGKRGGWVDGNFDGFLGINILDFGLLADNYGKGLTGAQSPVPEPAGVAVLVVGSLLGVRRPRLSQ